MSQQTPSANDVLMGGGGALTAKFTNPGDMIGGRIVAEPRVYQEREYDPRNPGNGAPKFYPKSGDPIMSVSVDVQTDLRDPSDPDDDGVRRIYIEGKRLKDAVRDAVRNAGADGLHVGDELHVAFTGLGQAENGMNAPKLYAAKYVHSSAGAALDALGGTQQPADPWATQGQQQTPTPTAPPAVAPVTQSAPAQVPTAAAPPAPAPVQTPAAQAKSLAALGLTAEQIAPQLGLDASVVAILLAS